MPWQIVYQATCHLYPELNGTCIVTKTPWPAIISVISLQIREKKQENEWPAQAPSPTYLQPRVILFFSS